MSTAAEPSNAARAIYRRATGIVRAASLIVPASRRREWLREWDGELSYRISALDRAGRLDARAAAAILFRTLGAFPHALWVLRNETRLETMLQDIRYALRSSLRRPAFAILVVLTLGVGIGANSAMFSIVNSVLLQPLPYERSEELVYMFGAFKGGNQASISPPDFLDYRERQTVFSSLAARTPFGSAVISGGDRPERVPASIATANFFSTLGVQPILGRAFRPDEEQGEHDVAIISHGLWQQRFGREPRRRRHQRHHRRTPAHHRRRAAAAPGRRDQRPGVAAGPVRHRRDDRAPLPLPARPRPPGAGRHGRAGAASRWTASRDSSSRRTRRTRRGSSGSCRTARSSSATWPPGRSSCSWARLGSCCSSPAATSRACCSRARRRAAARWRSARRSARHVRGSSGSCSPRASCSAWQPGPSVSGSPITSCEGVRAVGAGIVPRLAELALDRTALLFTFALSLATSLVFGLAPALQAAKGGVAAALTSLGKGSGGRSGARTRNVLVVAQVAVSFVMLIVAGLLIRSLWQLQRVDPGFDPHGVFTAEIALPGDQVPGARGHRSILVRVHRTACGRSLASRWPRGRRCSPSVAAATPTSTSTAVRRRPTPRS